MLKLSMSIGEGAISGGIGLVTYEQNAVSLTLAWKI
jgi:hypothetical protein